MFTTQLLFITYSMRIEKVDWNKCQKQPLEVFYGKKVFFKMPQNSQESPVPEETPVSFAKFLRIPLLQNNFGRLLLKCGHFNNEARDIDCIYCRELDALLYCFGQNPRARGKHLAIQFLWGSARLLVTGISLIQLII